MEDKEITPRSQLLCWQILEHLHPWKILWPKKITNHLKTKQPPKRTTPKTSTPPKNEPRKHQATKKPERTQTKQALKTHQTKENNHRIHQTKPTKRPNDPKKTTKKKHLLSPTTFAAAAFLMTSATGSCSSSRLLVKREAKWKKPSDSLS